MDKNSIYVKNSVENLRDGRPFRQNQIQQHPIGRGNDFPVENH